VPEAERQTGDRVVLVFHEEGEVVVQRASSSRGEASR
jgi:hypothetical protein